jgi:lysophospholipase L1-like esterase
MATFNLTTTPSVIDQGVSDFIRVRNASDVVVIVTRGGYEIERLRPGASGTYYLEHEIPVYAAVVSGLGAVDVVATAKAALPSATFARISNPFEKMPFTCYGHSFMAAAGGAGTTTGARWPERIAARLATGALVNNAVSGTSMSEIAARALTTWTPATRGLVAMMGILNSVQYLEGASTCAESLRAALAVLTASAKFEESSTIFAFNGTWVAGPTTNVSGSASKRTTTVTDSVDVYLATGSGYLITQLSASSGGTIVATVSGTGAVVGTWSTNGHAPHTTPGPMVLGVSGLAAGVTVRFTLTAGTGFTVDGLLVPNTTNPPVIVFGQEGPCNVYTGASAANTVDVNRALQVSYGAACDAVIVDFPSVVNVRALASGWLVDDYTWVGDGTHPNDAGQVFLADIAQRALQEAVIGARDGLNLITASPMVVEGMSGYYVGSPTVPPTPTLFSAVGVVSTQANLYGSIPSTGGSAITGYKWQYRTTAGPGAWTDLPGSATAVTVATGLTNGTSYDFRMAATNAVGDSAWSAAATPTVVYAYDLFTRANASSLGTSTSGTAWTSTAANGIVSNMAGGSATVTANPSVIETSQATCTVQALVAAAGSVGIVGRATDISNHFIFTGSVTGAWQLYKRVAGVFTLLLDAGIVVRTGDVPQMVFSGNTITVKLNGVTIGAVTDAFNNTATKAGIRMSDAPGRLDDFFVTA